MDDPEKEGAAARGGPGLATACLATACADVLLFPLSVWVLAQRETEPDGYTVLAAIMAAGPLHFIVFVAAIGGAVVIAWRGTRNRTPGSWAVLIAAIFVVLLMLEAYVVVVRRGLI